MRHLSLAVLLLAPALALGQTSSLSQTETSRGTQLPPTGAALADEATAIAVNPAGLSAVGAGQLFYVHERSIARSQVADGLYLASAVPGLGAGFSVDWVRGTTVPDYRKTGWGFSLGSPTRGLALGASFNFYASDTDPALDKMMGVDLGVLARPWEFLSVGAVAKNLNAPSRDALSFARQYDVGIGLRPFGPRVTLGVDYLFGDSGLGDGQLSYVLQGEVISGLRLGAGFAHGLRELDPRVQLAFTLDTDHLGLTYAGGVSDGRLDHIAAVRLSTQRYREFAPGGGTYALLDLDDALADGSTTLGLLGLSRHEDPFLELVRWLEQARRDPELAGLVLKIDKVGNLGAAQIEELRQTVLRFRASGKRVIALILSATDKDYQLASAADRIYTTPQSVLLLDGFSAHSLFVGGAMEKLSVSFDVARMGAYKNFPDMFTRKDSSPEQRETVEAYLASDVRQFKKALADGRKLSGEKVEAIWREALITPKRAQELGLVDGVMDPSKIDEELTQQIPGANYDPEYSPRGKREVRWGERRRVAVIPVLGNISGGKSREGPLGSGAIAGAETVVRALDRARRDPRVAAIVVRVDSSGGDGLASDLMYRAVLEAKQSKPVVASMGDVAASGGYYAAVGADEILAQPTTITGSIGVFMIKPALGKLGESLGIHSESIKLSPLADILQPYAPWTPEEQAAAQKWVDAFYDDFITEVAKSRKLDKAKVDAVARGRVWSGEDAKTRGLVDGFGGLQDAIDVARKRANVPASEDLEVVVYGEPHGFLAAPGGESGVQLSWAEPVLDTLLANKLLAPRESLELPASLKSFAAELGVQAELLRAPGVKAMMPFTLHVE